MRERSVPAHQECPPAPRNSPLCNGSTVAEALATGCTMAARAAGDEELLGTSLFLGCIAGWFGGIFVWGGPADKGAGKEGRHALGRRTQERQRRGPTGGAGFPRHGGGGGGEGRSWACLPRPWR